MESHDADSRFVGIGLDQVALLQGTDPHCYRQRPVNC